MYDNVSQRRQRRTEPRPQGICRQNFVKIGPAVPEICSRTYRQTYRQTDGQADSNTPLPYRGGVTMSLCTPVLSNSKKQSNCIA